jgi:hypothetical protein
MSHRPLAEVFGYTIEDCSEEAARFRRNRLCPFGNKIPNCTKDKAEDPLGVCSILDGDNVVITCPIRFRENWIIAEDAASFFFPNEAKWTSLTEVKLKDRHGKSAGNIDIVVAQYDDSGSVIDFGALEIQAVYISGNVRKPFSSFMESCKLSCGAVWSNDTGCYPRPDYLSSSRKRLVPQLIFKGGILKKWHKKTAVALNRGFFETLPLMEEVSKETADIAWMIYDLVYDKSKERYTLKRYKMVYTGFDDSLAKISASEAGEMQDFLEILQLKLDKRNGEAPDNRTIEQPFQ